MVSDFRVLTQNRVERREAVLKELKKKKQDIMDNNPVERRTPAMRFDIDKLEKGIDEIEGEIAEILLQAKRYNKGE
jgi:uncharacterized protein Yka (UPF0111/DUF47 family)